MLSLSKLSEELQNLWGSFGEIWTSSEKSLAYRPEPLFSAMWFIYLKMTSFWLTSMVLLPRVIEVGQKIQQWQDVLKIL
ncbi:hypothetical protein B1F69_00520 [Pseudomonas syringae]|nr:hypothetical protein B1F69_00520 [Pseudomonas syringae]